jgi:hypothetical protein
MLHEAIVKILHAKNCEMNTKDISDEVNKRKVYAKKDGSDITAFQIHGRTKNYPKLFTRRGSSVGLVEWISKPKVSGSQLLEEPSIAVALPEISWIQAHVTTITFLENSNFINIGLIKNLFSSGLPSLPELGSCGLYAISIPKNYKPTFISPEQTRVKKNVLYPWPIEKLNDKWVDTVDIIYYGLAGKSSPRSLRKRIGDLINHGLGKTTDRGPHKGGEILWQLQGYEEFSIWIKPTGCPPEPRDCEHRLLIQFHKNTGKLPFANRQF